VATIDTLGYPIVVEFGALGGLTALVHEHARAHSYAIVTDENVAPHYLSTVQAALSSETRQAHIVVIPAGEQHKTREQWASISDALLSRAFGRDTMIVALGGGVIGDLAGFVAATYMRGVPVIQIPTTLLSMVDASVGGKTAVDTPAGKNTVGAFHPPSLVVIDPTTLETLPRRDLISGLAEVIKHGVIGDASELDAVRSIAPDLLGGGKLPMGIAPLIERSVRIKARVVAADERELGLRKILNFGHTIGHGVEAASDYSLLHGEAIAIGMIAEAELAERQSIAERGTRATIESALVAVNLPTRVPADLDHTRILALMQSDKKRRGNSLEYALPRRIGEMAAESAGWAIPIPNEFAMEALRAVTAEPRLSSR
jgi:3-dehydroquinate synthase